MTPLERLAHYRRRAKFFTVRRVVNRFLGYPTQLLIETTNVCNLSCPMCTTAVGQDESERKKGYLHLDDFKRILDAADPYVNSVGLFYGGEPMLNKQLPAMVAYARQKRVETFFSTNATMLTDDAIEEVLDCGLDKMTISFDGLSKETYEKYRVGADFHDVYAKIQKIARRKKERGLARPHLQLQFIVMKHNQHEIPGLAQAKRDLGVDEIVIKAVAIPTWIYDDQGKVNALFSEWLPEKKWSKYKGERAGAQVKGKQNRCEWLHKGVVHWDGRLSLCCFDYDAKHVYGNLLTTPLSRIWNSLYGRKLRKEVLENRFPLCSRCSISDETVLGRI